MKKFKIIIVSFILLVFMISCVTAHDLNSSNDEPIASDEIKEIYVNVTGDDSYDGSKTNPYASINNSISNVDSSKENII